MPYLAHMATSKVKEAEQAAAFLVSLANYWDQGQRDTLSDLHTRLKQELSGRKPAWTPSSVPADA